MNEGRYCLKHFIIDIFIFYFIKYFHSFIQSAVFTGRVARRNNGLYVLRVKLAYLADYFSSYIPCVDQPFIAEDGTRLSSFQLSMMTAAATPTVPPNQVRTKCRSRIKLMLSID